MHRSDVTFDPELAAVKSDVVPALDSSPGGSASQDAPGSEGSDLNLSLHHAGWAAEGSVSLKICLLVLKRTFWMSYPGLLIICSELKNTVCFTLVLQGSPRN